MSSDTFSPVRQTQGTIKKLRTACDTCHQTKVRCSGGNPCQMCQHLEAECVYSPSNRKGRPKGTRPRKSQQETLSGNQTATSAVNSMPSEKSNVRNDAGKTSTTEGFLGLLSPDTGSSLFDNDLDDFALPDRFQDMLCAATTTSYTRSMDPHMNDGFPFSFQNIFSDDVSPFLDMGSSKASDSSFQPRPTYAVPPHESYLTQYSDNLGDWDSFGVMSSLPQRRELQKNYQSGFGSRGPFASIIPTTTSSNGLDDETINMIMTDDGLDCLQSHTASLCHQLGRVRSITTPRIDVLLTCARQIITASISLLRCTRCQNRDIQEVFMVIIAVLRLFVRKLQLSDEMSGQQANERGSLGIRQADLESMMVDDDLQHRDPAMVTPQELPRHPWQPRQSTSSDSMQQPYSVSIRLGDYTATKSEQVLVTRVLRRKMLQRLSEVIAALKRRIQITPSTSPSPFQDLVQKDTNTQSAGADDDSVRKGDGADFGDLVHLMSILQNLETVVNRLAG